MTKIGLIQASSVSDITANLMSIRAYAAQAQQSGCEVVCFPECFLTSYSPELSSDLAIRSDSDILQKVSAVAQEFFMDLLVGYMEQCDDLYYITHGLFRRDGTRAVYRKSHLGKKEQLYFAAGDRLDVFPLSTGIKAGFQICVETHFPDITQTLALKGAEIIFAPHAVPRIFGDREKIWNKYIPARSYDNRVFFACCNLWDEDRFGGGCLITDPRGECAAACFDHKPQLLVCDIDMQLATRYRTPGDKPSTQYYPAKRRKELYE